MGNLATTRILFQPEQAAHAGPSKPWLWPLPRLDGAAPCILAPTDRPGSDVFELGYRDRESSPALVPVFAPRDGTISYAARTERGGVLCLDHAGGWSSSYAGLETVRTPLRDRCSGRRKARVRAGDVLGYLRKTLRLGFGLSRWDDGAWTSVDPAELSLTWAVQPWFTEPSCSASSSHAS